MSEGTANLLPVKEKRLRGQRIPKGTLVYAVAVDGMDDEAYVEGPLDCEVGESGDVEYSVATRLFRQESTLVLTPGLVDLELRIALAGCRPDWAIQFVDDQLRYQNRGWGGPEEVK